ITPEPPPSWPWENTCTVERRKRSAISPNSRMSVPPGPLPNYDADRHRRAAAHHSRLDLLADSMAFQHALDIVRIGHCGPAERNQDVADQHPRFRRRAI